ncbi:MAG: hypothetical protein HC796_10805 [Synechococcaceae cyanobacterium RL_1_2]|nr:hypothetical protein [Synechococcaceae cyanobacterium RL_1_2]
MKTFSLPFWLSVGAMTAAMLVETSPVVLGQSRTNIPTFSNTSTETAYTLGPAIASK